MLTPEKKQEYIASPHHCPYCKSDDLTITDKNSDYNQVWHDILCESCDKTWKDIYTLTDMEENI